MEDCPNELGRNIDPKEVVVVSKELGLNILPKELKRKSGLMNLIIY